MNIKRYIPALILLILFSFAFKNEPHQQAAINVSERTIPDGLKILLKAYPDYIDSVDENHLYWRGGEVMIYDDGKDKTTDEKVENASLKDMFSQKYTAGQEYDIPEKDFDPGRFRNTEFFGKMYGYTEAQVRNNLVYINWMPTYTKTRLLVTQVNGVDRQLQAVSDELEKLPSELRKYVTKTAGTFSYREIAGTNVLSTHSYGIAIDINTDYSDYWRWSKSGEYRNRIPMEIVSIFEKYGFIWGGKWYHFDTMHFEYRPEMLIKP